jgi:hypothetical protein
MHSDVLFMWRILIYECERIQERRRTDDTGRKQDVAHATRLLQIADQTLLRKLYSASLDSDPHGQLDLNDEDLAGRGDPEESHESAARDHDVIVQLRGLLKAVYALSQQVCIYIYITYAYVLHIFLSMYYMYITYA